MNIKLMPFSTPKELALAIVSNDPRGYLYSINATNYVNFVQGLFTQYFYFLKYAQNIIEGLPASSYTSPNDYNPLLNSDNPLLDKYVAQFGIAQFGAPLNTTTEKANAIALFFRIRLARTLSDITKVFFDLGYDVTITPGTGANIFTVYVTIKFVNQVSNLTLYGASTANYGTSLYNQTPNLEFVKTLLTNLFPCYIYVVFT